MSVEAALRKLADSYSRKKLGGSGFIVSIDVDGGGLWHIVVEQTGRAELVLGEHVDAAFTVVLSGETLKSLLAGKISPLTAAGRENLHQLAPLDYRIPDGVSFSKELYHRIVLFSQRFFNAMPGERIRMAPDAARLVHGAHVVGLFADVGFRSGWYQINPGERLNEPGDTNPFPQAFVVLSGSGTVQIGDNRMEAESNCAYYIAPGLEHTVEPSAEEAITLIWMAWGEGA